MILLFILFDRRFYFRYLLCQPNYFTVHEGPASPLLVPSAPTVMLVRKEKNY